MQPHASENAGSWRSRRGWREPKPLLDLVGVQHIAADSQEHHCGQQGEPLVAVGERVVAKPASA
jgi:hypothetical protein